MQVEMRGGEGGGGNGSFAHPQHGRLLSAVAWVSVAASAMPSRQRRPGEAYLQLGRATLRACPGRARYLYLPLLAKPYCEYSAAVLSLHGRNARTPSFTVSSAVW